MIKFNGVLMSEKRLAKIKAKEKKGKSYQEKFKKELKKK